MAVQAFVSLTGIQACLFAALPTLPPLTDSKSTVPSFLVLLRKLKPHESDAELRHQARLTASHWSGVDPSACHCEVCVSRAFV